jgi:hypothetical protein
VDALSHVWSLWKFTREQTPILSLNQTNGKAAAGGVCSAD